MRYIKASNIGFVLLLTVLLHPIITQGQAPAVVVDLATLDGIELKQSNVFNYRIVNNSGITREVTVTGTIKFRNSRLQTQYSYDARIYPGNNQFGTDKVMNPKWTFSDNALKELFFYYDKLPQGTYEYCVNVLLKKITTENIEDDPINDCIYQTVNDIFLINLVEPENDARIYEHYPMLSWVVNYPFASALTYRLRLVELKEGQSNENAITRNNPIYQESNLSPTSLIYPVTAKPLQVFQPYVWTVDAYYKGILLGGAEAWKFTIIEDSIIQPNEVVQSYFEFERHIAETRIEAAGVLKLKYVLDKETDTMQVELYDSKGKIVNIPNKKIALKNGSNLIDIVFQDKVYLKHKRDYNLRVNINGRQFDIPFVYINPMFQK